MERQSPWLWVRRALVGALGLGMLLAGAITWRLMDIVQSDLLSTQPVDPVVALVVAVSDARIVLTGGDQVDRAGVWGIAGPKGFGQVTEVISNADGSVERAFVGLSGSIDVGDSVTFDSNVYPSDPRTALGLLFEEIRVPGELGVNPAWLIDGQSDTWVVFVHGRGAGLRAESLRSLPSFRKLGFPVLVITYRTDNAFDGSAAELSTWGLEEWRDLQTALDAARLRGARDFILVGHDLGASIVTMFLHNSEALGQIRGVVLDSPIIDLEGQVDRIADARGIPGLLAELGKGISRIRYGLEWDQLDQLARVEEFDPSIPMLLLHGGADEFSPIALVEAFAAALPGATLERFPGAGHGALWNTESARYDAVITEFFVSVIPELARDDGAG
jgi:pimeloyl-ACP methyl ester carboxylesterase